MSSWGNKRLHQEVEEPSANVRRWRQLEEAYQAEERVPVVSGVAVITMPDGSQKMVLASEAHEFAANESASQDVLENEAGANVAPAGGQDDDVENGSHDADANVAPAGGQDDDDENGSHDADANVAPASGQDDDVEKGSHDAVAKDGVSVENAEETAAEGATTNQAQDIFGESIALPASPSVVPTPLQDVTNIMEEPRPIGNRADEQRECERLKLEIETLRSLNAQLEAERDHFKNELTALKDRVRAGLHSLMEELQSDVETFRNDEDDDDGYHEENAEYKNGSTDANTVPAGGQDEVLGEQAEEGSEEGTSGAGEGKADQDPGKRGADTLKHVSRACGEPLQPPEKLVSMYAAFSSDDATLAAIAALSKATDSTVRGVKLGSIMRELVERLDSPRLDAKLYVEWMSAHAPAYTDGKNRELRKFRIDDIGSKYSSPLTLLESDFARECTSTLKVVARALQSPTNELEVAFRKVAAMPNGDQRMCQARSVYFYTIKILAHGIELGYVGESVDVERRMNDHLIAIFGPDKPLGKQKRHGGHDLARAEIAGTRCPSAVEFDAQVLMAFDENSVLELARSYIDFCADNFKALPKTSDGILEVARAIGTVGFLAEAMYTVKYNTLNSESTETWIGMNISQPGIIRTSLSSSSSASLSPTPNEFDQYPLVEYKEMAKKAKKAKKAENAKKEAAARAKKAENAKKTQAKKAQSKKEFSCATCKKTCTDHGFKRTDGGAGKICRYCHDASSPPFDCSVCHAYCPTGSKRYNRTDGGDGKKCDRCYCARKKPFDCAYCNTHCTYGIHRYKAHGGDDGNICSPCYKATAPPFHCTGCDRHLEAGSARYIPPEGGDDRICHRCYSNNFPPFHCAGCGRHLDTGSARYIPGDGSDGHICRRCKTRQRA